MATQGTEVTILGSDYFVPTQSESPPWGDDLHDTVVALANAVNSLSPSGNIPLTTFQLANNQAVAANITGASFDVSSIRSFIMNYSIYRSTNINEGSEVGVLYGTYSSIAATWDLSQTYGGSSSVILSITSGGQVQYTSSNLTGTSYAGKIKFTAYSFTQS